MLTCNKVEVVLSAKGKKHFSNLGYMCGDKHSTLEVNITDLPIGSKVYVPVRCARCGKDTAVQYQSYLKKINKHGNYMCKACGCTRHNSGVAEARSVFIAAGLTPLFTTYKNQNEQLSYVCNKHPFVVQTKTLNNARRMGGCRYCRIEKIGKGPSNALWKGGITPLLNYLRAEIKPWVRDSLKAGNYTCFVTGKVGGRLTVHHCDRTFKSLVHEALAALGLSIDAARNAVDSSAAESLAAEVLKKHYASGLGVCMSQAHHMLFHQQYGNKNTTRANLIEYTYNNNVKGNNV